MVFCAVIVGNIVGISLILWACDPGESKVCSAFVEHLRYFTVIVVSAIAIIVSSCVIGARSIFAALLKRMQASGE